MKKVLYPLVVAIASLSPRIAIADPAVGIGISIISTKEFAIGLRVFSDNRPGRAAAALGLDYKLRSKSLRPTIGAAWLEDGYYADLSLGYDTSGGQIDFGAGIGATGNMQNPAAPAPAPGGGGGSTAETRMNMSF